MTYDLAVLEGDDIGLEIVPIAVDVLRAALDLAGVTDVTLHPLPIGAAALGPHGTTFPDHTREALSAMDGVILGPIGHAAYPKGAVNPHPIIRRELDLYANHRPARPIRTCRACTRTWTWWCCGRTTRASNRTATCWQAPASSNRIPTTPTASE